MFKWAAAYINIVFSTDSIVSSGSTTIKLGVGSKDTSVNNICKGSSTPRAIIYIGCGSTAAM